MCKFSQTERDVTSVTTSHSWMRAGCDATKGPVSTASWEVASDFRA